MFTDLFSIPGFDFSSVRDPVRASRLEVAKAGCFLWTVIVLIAAGPGGAVQPAYGEASEFEEEPIAPIVLGEEYAQYADLGLAKEVVRLTSRRASSLTRMTNAGAAQKAKQKRQKGKRAKRGRSSREEQRST